jgi:hypothetical protein
MPTEIEQSLFQDTLQPGYNSFTEALADAVTESLRKRRLSGLVQTEAPSINTSEDGSDTDMGSNSSEEETVEAVKEKVQADDDSKIVDFGEKLGGARKDLYQKYRDMIMKVSKEEVISYPLSKLWPQPNYTKLLEEGIEPWRVAMLRALREDLGRRPAASSYKIHKWVDKFLRNRSMAEEILDTEYNASKFSDYIYLGCGFSDETVSKAYMYLKLGADTPVSDFPYRISYFSSLERVYMNGESHSNCYGVMNHGGWNCISICDSFAEALDECTKLNKGYVDEKIAQKEAINNLKNKSGNEAVSERKYDDFLIRGWRGAKGYWFIGKKYNGEWVEVKKPFETPKEARSYLENNKDEIQDLFDRFKFVPNMRRLENLPRTETGNPARAKDITPDEFSATFGFRGVEFGNWVENDKRQKDLNEAYDGLMDLANVLNVPPQALSLCGELGLRFGSNGRGGKNAAKAHYEPDLIAINLTKKKGAGSLAHEWFHAMDHYFNRHVGEKSNSHLLFTETKDVRALENYISQEETFRERNLGQDAIDRQIKFQNQIYANSIIRREVLEKFAGVVKAFKVKLPDVEKTYIQRSENQDKYRSKAYWSTTVELAARAFEAYVSAKLEERGIRNDYLVNYLKPEEYAVFVGQNPDRLSGAYPYPVPQEMPAIKKAFDELFEAIDTREDKDGKIEMYSSSDYRYSRLEKCETVFDAELSEVQKELKNFASTVLGQEVEYFDGPEVFHGSYDPLENNILLNINSEKPVDWVLWHESFHALAALEPETYKELMDYMDAKAPISQEQIEAYRESVKGYDLPDDVVKQELLADAFADMKKRETMMEQMKESSPGLFGKVSSYFSRVKNMAKDFFFRKDDVKLTEEQFSHFEYVISQIEIGRLGSEQELFEAVYPDGATEKEEFQFASDLVDSGITAPARRILEQKDDALEGVLCVAQHREDKNRKHYTAKYLNEKKTRLAVIDFTPQQQREFDIQFAKNAISEGARPKDVEFILKNTSQLGKNKKMISDIMKEAQLVHSR